jgi:PncC family amidohydrolase
MSIAEELVKSLGAHSLKLALAESCTAGLAASMLAEVPGASKALWGSFVCYTPEAKRSMLGIDGRLLRQYGLVSAETARAMALGALEKSGACLSAAITGLAGPEGDGSAIPVGTVWIALAWKGAGENAAAAEYHFTGTRNEVRQQAADAALKKLLAHIDRKGEKR